MEYKPRFVLLFDFKIPENFSFGTYNMQKYIMNLIFRTSNTTKNKGKLCLFM